MHFIFNYMENFNWNIKKYCIDLLAHQEFFIFKYDVQLLLSTMQRNIIPICSSFVEMDLRPILHSCGSKGSKVAPVMKLFHNF